MAIISNAVTMADAGAFSVSLGSMTLIKTIIANDSDNVTFVHGTSSVVIDNTFPIYLVKVISAHVDSSGSGEYLRYNFRDGGSAYDAVKTSVGFRAIHTENDNTATLGMSGQVNQETGFFNFTNNGISVDNDQNHSGELLLFNPSSTTFVKHFMGTSNVGPTETAGTTAYYHDGYCNTTAAIDGIQFSCTGSGSKIGAGIFKLYGIKDS